MRKLRLALDWTPNTNHIGFYVAIGKGWYKENGIDLEILSPSDSYEINETPGRRLVNGEVDMCIGPSESLISCWTTDEDKIRPIAVAALLADDTSAVTIKVSSGIESPKQLDGKVYASYGGRFEMNIIQQLVKNAGGKGDIIESNPLKLDCFGAVINNEADATWIFVGWEGLLAQKNGHDLKYFFLSDYGVPYGYSPLLLAHPLLLEDSELLQSFLNITARGYEHAVSNPREAAKLLLSVSNHKSLHDLGLDFIEASIEYLSDGHFFNDENSWGSMSTERWRSFVNWLTANNLLSRRDGSLVQAEELPIEDMCINLI